MRECGRSLQPGSWDVNKRLSEFLVQRDERKSLIGARAVFCFAPTSGPHTERTERLVSTTINDLFRLVVTVRSE